MADEDKHLRETLEGVLKTASNRELSQRALALLFPKIEKILKTPIYSGNNSVPERIRQRRISVADFSSAYFRLDPERATWGREEINFILRQMDPALLVSHVEKKLRSTDEPDRGRLRRLLLEQMDYAFDKRHRFDDKWLRALVDIGPSFIKARDEVIPFLFSTDNRDRLRRIVLHALEPLRTEERAQIFEVVIPHAKDVTLLADLIRTIAGDVAATGSRNSYSAATLGDSTPAIRDMLVTRIRGFAKRGEIWSRASPAVVLWFWWGSGYEKEIRIFTERAIKKHGVGLRSLLNECVNLVRSSAGDYENVQRESWSKFVDLELLAAKAKGLLKAESDEDKKLAQRFLTALAKNDHSSHEDG
jgi:hypothetical protein